jgi:BioD-like phosphotransacetylase family protein
VFVSFACFDRCFLNISSLFVTPPRSKSNDLFVESINRSRFSTAFISSREADVTGRALMTSTEKILHEEVLALTLILITEPIFVVVVDIQTFLLSTVAHDLIPQQPANFILSRP